MLEVCLYMDMTTSTYERIRQRYANIILGEIALLKAALDQQPHGKELENLSKALIESGQQSLADKIQQLHSKGEPLHNIWTSESVERREHFGNTQELKDIISFHINWYF